MRVLHQAAEIPVTPQQEIFDEAGRFIARADLRIDGTRRIHEYDGAGIARLISTRSIWNATVHSSPRAGSGTASPQNTCGETPQPSSLTLGRAWNPRRLAAWQSLLDHSLLGRAGRARAYRSWRRADAETGQQQQGEGRYMGGK